MTPTLLLIAACSGLERAPDGWPASGCAAGGGGGGFDRDDLRLESWDGVELAMGRLRPDEGECFAAVVLVPPGFQGGMDLLPGDQAEDLARAGRMVVSWDPRGRGESCGAEDANGYAGQDDLAELLRWVAWQEDVDPTAVVVASRSFGGALAAGALGRHAELAVRGWLDVESPGWTRDDLAYAPEHNQETFEHWLGDADPDAWWAEREPAGLIGGVAVPYRRLQGLPDHALGHYLGHAIAMVGEATAAPEVWYNDAPVEAPLDLDSAEAGAVQGGIDGDGEEVTAAILAM